MRKLNFTVCHEDTISLTLSRCWDTVVIAESLNYAVFEFVGAGILKMEQVEKWFIITINLS